MFINELIIIAINMRQFEGYWRGRRPDLQWLRHVFHAVSRFPVLKNFIKKRKSGAKSGIRKLEPPMRKLCVIIGQTRLPAISWAPLAPLENLRAFFP